MSNDKNFPASSPSSSKPILKASQEWKGDKGDPAVLAIAQPWHLALPCDSDGSNVDYTNKTVIIMIVEANSILAEGNTVNGWSMVIDSSTDCTVSVNNLIASVNVIAANHASFTLKLSHISYTDLYLTAKVSKIHKGEIGDTGDTGGTGGTGDQGIQGPAGNDGTGLVIIRKHVKVKPKVNITVTNSGGYLLCTTVADHDVVLGEYLHLDLTTYGEIDQKITEIVTSKSFKVDKVYSADAAGDFYSWWHFLSVGNDDPQLLKFPLICSVGAKLDEFALIKKEGSSEVMLWDAGPKPYPDAGYSSYANSIILEDPEDIIQVNLWDPSRSGYSPKFMYYSGAYGMDLYCRASIYGAADWNSELVNDEWYVYFSYKYFTYP